MALPYNIGANHRFKGSGGMPEAVVSSDVFTVAHVRREGTFSLLVSDWRVCRAFQAVTNAEQSFFDWV